MSANLVEPDDLTPDERFAVLEIGDSMTHRVFPRSTSADRLV